MIEEWRPVATHPAYEVSNFGRVRRGGRILSPGCKKGGYPFVGLCSNDGRRYVRISRLVLSAFKPTDNPKLWVLHSDGNSHNNHISNLRWGTPKDNHADSKKHGTYWGGYRSSGASRGERCPWSKLTDVAVRSMREAHAAGGRSIADLARQFGVSSPVASKVISNKAWKHVG